MLEDRLKLYTPREVKEMNSTPRRVFGAPYPFPHPRTVFPVKDEGKLKGIITEHAVANMLNLLTYDFPNLYVFHSVGNFGEDQEETDNVVIFGNYYIIVETKSSSNHDSISVSSDGEIFSKKDGKRRLVTRNNKIREKMANIEARHPDVHAQGLFVVRRADKTGSSFSSMIATTVDNLLPDIQNLLGNIERRKNFSAKPQFALLKETMGLCIRHECIPPFL